MKRFKELAILITLLFINQINSHGEPGLERDQGASVDEEPTEFGPPCPLDFSPSPCICTGHSKSRNLDCSNAADIMQITTMLQSYRTGLPFADFKLQQCNLTSLLAFGFPDMHNFTVFYISECPIKNVDGGLFAGSRNTVKHITIKNTMLTAFPFDSLNNYTQLESLDLSNNMLESIQTGIFGSSGKSAFGEIGLPKLRDLYLNGNRITTISSYTFSNLPFLEILNLSENNITYLGANALSNPNMKDVAIVMMKSCNVSEIDAKAFEDLTYSSVNLEDNKLTNFPRQTLDALLKHLEINDATIYLAGNKFNCTPELRWVVEKPPEIRRHLRDYTCQDGKQLEGLVLSDLENYKQH